MREFEDGRRSPVGFIAAIIGGVAATLVGLTVVFGSWYTIDQGERGVLLRNGRISGIATPGLGFKLPMVDSVVRISLQSHLKKFDKMAIYSKDQQTAEVRLSIGFRATESGADDIYAQYGSLPGIADRLITPKVFEEAKTVFGQYNAVTAIQERARLNADIRAAITKAIGSAPIVIESVQIENIDFSDVYEKAIEARMTAEVEVQKLRQNAERTKVEAEITVTQAKAQADSVRLAAQASADAIKLRGTAEATAIQAKGDALAKNPALVSLIQAERWDGKLPATMVPGGSVPMLNLGGAK